jgi:hypothetical protein
MAGNAAEGSDWRTCIDRVGGEGRQGSERMGVKERSSERESKEGSSLRAGSVQITTEGSKWRATCTPQAHTLFFASLNPARSCNFFLMFDSQRHNDDAKLQTWHVLLPFPKKIDCIKCAVRLRIKEIDFFGGVICILMMKWSLMDTLSENVIGRNAGREMMP